MWHPMSLVGAGVLVLGAIACASAPPAVIRPGAVWLDDRGLPVQAHGGGMLKVGPTWFWFGEDRTRGLDPAQRHVGCYASDDLVRWQFRRRIAFSDPDHLGPRWVLERPKVFYNAKTKKFVMYMHIDDASYRAARVGVATCDRVDGQYQMISTFRPLGQQSRDIGMFVDDDGSAYLIFEDRPHGIHIARISEDGLHVVEDVYLIHQRGLEAATIVKYQGLYYLVCSRQSGWDPNPNKFATAKALGGPWSPLEDIAPPKARTYGAQSTLLLKVVGTKQTTVIFMGDMWRRHALWDSRYLWMPLEIGAGKLHLPAPRPWTIDVKIGEVRFPATQPAGEGPEN